MTNLELLAELIEDLARDLRPEVGPLTPEELDWNPGPQANSIGVTLWHMARGMDLLAVRVLQSKLADEEHWPTNGWREKTSYDPRGVGYRAMTTGKLEVTYFVWAAKLARLYVRV